MTVQFANGMALRLLLFFILLSACFAAEPEYPLTLDEAIRLSLRMSEDVLVQRETVAAVTQSLRGCGAAGNPAGGYGS